MKLAVFLFLAAVSQPPMQSTRPLIDSIAIRNDTVWFLGQDQAVARRIKTCYAVKTASFCDVQTDTTRRRAQRLSAEDALVVAALELPERPQLEIKRDAPAPPIERLLRRAGVSSGETASWALRGRTLWIHRPGFADEGSSTRGSLVAIDTVTKVIRRFRHAALATASAENMVADEEGLWLATQFRSDQEHSAGTGLLQVRLAANVPTQYIANVDGLSKKDPYAVIDRVGGSGSILGVAGASFVAVRIGKGAWIRRWWQMAPVGNDIAHTLGEAPQDVGRSGFLQQIRELNVPRPGVLARLLDTKGVTSLNIGYPDSAAAELVRVGAGPYLFDALKTATVPNPEAPESALSGIVYRAAVLNRDPSLTAVLAARQAKGDSSTALADAILSMGTPNSAAVIRATFEHGMRTARLSADYSYTELLQRHNSESNVRAVSGLFANGVLKPEYQDRWLGGKHPITWFDAAALLRILKAVETPVAKSEARRISALYPALGGSE